MLSDTQYALYGKESFDLKVGSTVVFVCNYTSGVGSVLAYEGTKARVRAVHDDGTVDLHEMLSRRTGLKRVPKTKLKPQ